ncbi:unnamed protein product [Chilo suppressalis]|uniref:Chitin-binding type-2 domain-containing protein n=1 Tax=Chilo suppressalis TaxID=168631 RepID=A0ABN8AQ22_CHISP|nr:unnamed protein product [Chilo suppressalis]
MAFGRNVSKEFTRIIILILFASPVISANINCDGKAFHCVNSTHFMICVDLGGGVLSALDSFVIPCPLSTECRKTNYYECEFPKPVKLETMNKSVVNVLSPVIEPTTISTETSASSPKELSSYTTGSSNPSITVLPEVSNNVYVDKSDLPQESIGNNVPITTESFKSLLDTATENETMLGRNSFDDTISPNKADTVQVSTVSRELNQTFQDLVDINVSSTIDYKTAVNTSNTRKTQTFEILNDTMKLTSTDIFQMPAKTLINSISNLNTITALVQENTTSSPLSTTGYFETRTENRVPNKPLYPSKKNTTMQNKIENVQTSTDTNLLNISDNFQGLTGISENTLSSNVINKTDFYQAPTNKSVSHKHEYLIYPDTISNTTESNQTPTDISTTTKTELLNDGLPIDTILLNSDNFQGPGGTSHLPPAEDVNKQNYTQTYQLELDANINNKTDIFNASSSSKLKSLQELVTTNLQSTKEYFKSTTDTRAPFDTQLHKIKYTITDNKTELLEVTDNISRTMGYIQMSTDSSMSIARDQIDVDIINENNKYVTNSTSIINELQYTDFHPSNASAVTNVDNIVENNLNNYLQNNSDIDFNQNNAAEVFVKNTTDVHNKDKALNKVTNNNSTLYDITNYSNLSQVMITINDIVTNTYKDININTATKIEEFDTPTTENSRNQEIITENDFMPNKRNMGTTDAVSRNTMPPLELQSDVDLSTTHLTLFSAPPTLLDIASNTENSNRVEERHLEHTTSYVTATNSMYDDIKYTAQLANTNDNIPTINNNVNNRIVNRTRKFDNFDEFKLEPVNILNNTNNIKLKNITNAAVPQTSYTTELYISEISILNDSVINQTYYPTSVSGLTEIAQNSELQTTTPNTYIYSTTEYIENGNQLLFPETTTTSTPTLSSNIKNEYKDVLNIKQTHAENSYNLYSNTNGSPITEPVTSQIELDNHSLFDNTNTTKQELNKTDTKHTHVTSDHIEIKYQSLNKQKVSELIIDKNNVTNSNKRVNSITQSENIDESNLETVNIHNNKSHILKSIPTAPESLITYTTEQYKNTITVLNDSTINQTLVTPFSGLMEITIATNTGANTTAEFAEKEKPLIFPETSTSNTKSSSKTKNDHHGVLKTLQTDAEDAKKIYSYTNDSLITEPATSLIDVDSKFSQQDTTNYTPFLDNKNTTMTIDLNNTGTKHIQATTDQIRIGVTSANMQKYSETTIGTINVVKSNANMDTGVSDPNTKSVNLSESPLTYNFIKMFSVSNLTSFQEPVTVKMEIKNDIVDYQMPETTTGYLQVDSINESVNTNQSNLPSTTRFQINKENKETINNTQVTDPPTASYQFIIDKSSVNDIYAGVNNTYRRIHEKLVATSNHMKTVKKNISPILLNTGYNSDANSSILTNKTISETFHTITKLTDNIQTQTEKKSRAQSMRPNVNSIYKPEMQPTDNLKITAQAYEYHLKNKVQPNISLSTDLNDYTKDALKIGGPTQPTRETALTTNGTWNYPSAPQSFGNNITNSSYLYNNSQNIPLGNDSLISSKTNVGEQSPFIQINSTRSTINVKYRKSLQSIVAMNNGTTSKSSQQKSFSKNNTMEKNETHILQKPETIIHVQKLQFHCHNRSRGRYSDTEDCSIFYICIGKLEPIIGKCPARTVFSDIRKQCTKNMSHCIRQSKFKCTTAGRFSDILKPNTYYICVRRNISFVRYKFQCLNGYFLNKTLVKCMVDTEPESQRQTSVSYDSSKSDISFNENSNTNKASSKIDSIKKSEKIFKCEKEGKFADKSDCRKYYLCTKNNKSEFRTRKKKCESDEVFHKDEKKCVDADSNEC